MHFINTAKIIRGMEGYGEIPSEKEIVRHTIKIAWPSVLESFFVNLTGVVDTIMVGALGTASIAAVGLTTQPKFLALAIFIAINISVSSIVARRKGENDRESAIKMLRMSILLTIALTLIISTVFIIFAPQLIKLVGAKEDTLDLAVGYYRIIMGGIIFTTLTLVINAAQKGAGNTRISMVTNLISNVVNVIFNYLLIGGKLGFPALGVNGAAIATVIGSVFGCVLSIISVMRRDNFLCIREVKGWIADKLSRQSMIKVGSSAFVEQICLRVGFFLFVMTVANLGTVEMAAHQIGMNMMSLSFAFGDGFSVAAMTLIGQSLGKRRPDMAKIYGNACQRVGLCFALLVSLTYSIFGRQLFELFDENPLVLDYGSKIMFILSIMLILQIEQVVQFGCLRGAGDTKYTAMVSLISVTIIRPAMSFLLCYPAGLGLIGAWLGTACDQLVRFTLSLIRFKKGKWTKLKL